MLNEFIDDTQHRKGSKEIILNRAIGLKLIAIHSINIDKGQQYLTRLILTFRGQPILCNYSELILFMEELALFDRGDPYNTFFKIVSNKDKSKHHQDANPTYLILDSSELTMRISRSMAKSIYKIWDMYLRGYSMSYLLENSEHIDIGECVQILVYYGYLSYEQYGSMGIDP